MLSFLDLRKRRGIPCLAHLPIYHSVRLWARTVDFQVEILQPGKCSISCGVGGTIRHLSEKLTLDQVLERSVIF